MPDLDVAAYLRRLGVTDPGPPSVAALHRLHRAHVELVPYENLEIQLDRPTSTDPYESAERVVRHRRGGYCFHLNGAFSALLAALGYDVTWHRGGVQGRDEPRPPGATGNHLVLTVQGLPSPECPDGAWFADAGLGDALHDPLPLRPGTYRQGPCTYGLAPSEVVPGGWRFTHDPGGSFAGMDFAPQRATRADFAEMHRHLSTSPQSSFVQKATVQRRHAFGVDSLVGCRLRRAGPGGAERREATTSQEWYEMLADVFGLTLPDVSAAQRRALWSRVRAAHEAWLATQDAVPRDGSAA